MGKKLVTKETHDHIVALHTHASFNKTDFTKKVVVSGKCVRTTLKNFKKFNSPIESPRCGAPKKTAYYDDKCIFRQARLDPKISNQTLAS